jgi:MFS family permease
MTAALLRLNSRTFASVKKHRNYRLFFLGQTVSLPGTWIQRFAMAWLVYSLTNNSAIAVGVLSFATFLPFTLFSLFAGVLVDRFNAHRTVLATQFCHMVLATTIATITLAGVVQPWHVYVIAFAAGLVQVLDAPARQQLTFRMVGRDELQNAVSLNSSVFNASRIYGPALAGILIAAFGAGVCFTINAVSFFAVLAGLLMMRPSEFYPVEASRRPTMMRGVREGISYVLHKRDVLLNLSLVLVISTFCLNYNVLLPVLAKQTLHAGPRTFGILSAAFGAGALAGGLLAAAQGRARRSLMLIGGAAFGASELLLAPVHATWLACFLLFAGGVSFTTWSSNSNSLIQLSAPDHLRGRVIGLYFFAFAGTGSVGGLISGYLVHSGGTSLAFGVAGIVALASAAVISQLLRGRRIVPMRAEAEPPPERIAA